MATIAQRFQKQMQNELLEVVQRLAGEFNFDAAEGLRFINSATAADFTRTVSLKKSKKPKVSDEEKAAQLAAKAEAKAAKLAAKEAAKAAKMKERETKRVEKALKAVTIRDWKNAAKTAKKSKRELRAAAKNAARAELIAVSDSD